MKVGLRMVNGNPRWLEGISGDNGRRLIESESLVIKVLAGPGAGKTTCLVRRVMRLVDLRLVERRSDIFIGTFTRVIARSLDEAFLPPIPREGNRDDPVVRTLHAHAAALLRETPQAVHGRDFRFLLEHEETVMLYDIARHVPQISGHYERERELRRLQAHWASRTDPEDERFGAAVDTWLRVHGGMLVGEVVFLATNAIMSGDLSPVRFRHVFVDEYQDLTECEQTFVDLLVRADGSVVVLGDNDQSIYGFRYNHPEGIAAFPGDEERRQRVDDIDLPINYRCARNIVALANRIAASAGSIKQPMVASKPEEGSVTYVLWQTLDDEVEGLAEVINARNDTRFLVLATRQFIGYRLKALIGEDAVTTFREQVLESHFVRERFAFATLLADEQDRVAIRAWFALKAEEPAQEDHRNADAYRWLSEQGPVTIETFQNLADGTIALQGSGRANIIRRAEKYLEDKARLPLQNLEDLLQALFDPELVGQMPGRHRPANETQANRLIRERLEREDREKATGDLDLLRRAALQIARSLEEPSLALVLERLRYRIGTRAPLLDEEQTPRVRIMTLHGAKGLEEDSVIVAGLADEIIPGPPDPHDEAAHVAEQRRLLYVAVTRAKNELILSWSSSMAVADTFANGIVRKATVQRKNGMPYSALTRTSLLPPQQDRPQHGEPWKRGQLGD
jgi:DNA helicase-2/ATP-dependent DNA helicase PcrA